jgi:hypothetical protein
VFTGLPAFAIKPMSATAFGLAVVTTVAALLLRMAVGYFDPVAPPYVPVLAAILVTEILAGVAAGLLAAVLGLGMLWFALGASMPWAFTPAALALYAATALAIIWVSEQYRSLLRRLQEKETASDRQTRLVEAENKVLGQIVARRRRGSAANPA